MSGLPRHAARRDLHEPEVIRAFEAAGASVEQTSKKGAPDLEVGFLGVNHKVEVKTDNEQLNEDQKRWHAAWRGEKPEIVRNEAQARRLIVIWTRAFAAKCRAEPNLDDDLAGQGVR